ncbi:MAG: Lrp/AsnC family transcriptional regulator [Candidatus Njordarchaeales archaeon]
MSSLRESSRLDEKDRKILQVLLENSRLSIRQIARKTGLSVSTVASRLRKLEESGIIRKYTIELDLEKLGYVFPVIIDVRVSKGKLFEVEKEIAKHSNVLAVYDITGEYDVMVYAIFRTRRDLDSFVKMLQRMEYVERTHTKLILNVVKDERGTVILD